MNTYWTSQRERIAEWGLGRTLGYYVFGVAAHKVGVRFWDAFEWPAQPELPAFSGVTTFSMLKSMEDWTTQDRQLLTQHQSITLEPLYSGFFSAGDRCAVARCDGSELACVCWIHPTNDYPFARNSPSYLIQYCFTLPQWRGRDLYPQTLAFACQKFRGELGDSRPIFVDCSSFNYASKRGILKAGFKPIGGMLRAFRKTWAWANRENRQRAECAHAQ